MQWFKHDSNAHTDAKLKKVRIRYGMEGYGLYWYCLELIAGDVGEANITFELEHDAELIAFDTGLHIEHVQEIMRYMVDLRLFESDSGRVTCMKMAKRLDKSMTSSPHMRKVITDMRVVSEDYAGYVYLILASGDPDSKLKIGRSKNPWQRVKEIRETECADGYNLELVATIKPDDAVSLETEFHRQFSQKRIKNEWFEYSNEIVDAASALAKATTDNYVELLRHVVVSPERKKEEKERKSTGRFSPPTLQEVADYCRERNNSVDPGRFIDHYETNGWVRGKTKIKSWKACVRTWEKDKPPCTAGNTGMLEI
jgi:hypothetical protein